MTASIEKGRVRQRALLGAFVLFGVSAMACAAESTSAGLERCATIAEAGERLACYDELAGRAAPAPAVTETARPVAESPAVWPPVAEVAQKPAPAAVPLSEPVAAKTLDDIDSETNPSAIADEAEELLVRARVTRCEKDARKKYYFVFDNGQVWKQVSDKRLRYRECEFDVTITRDFFGYKMQVDGEKGRIRIDRIQ